jgi:hypothetical protein
MLTPEQKNQFSDILEELGKTLDVTETQYNAVAKSYQAVGDWLSNESSSLAPYNPEILPQGSFLLGTMIKPVHENDELDIDLVCQLKGKNPSWTQKDLKDKVGDRIKDNATYKAMLDDEGKRCWTLVYSEASNYHMDILPSIVDHGYRMMLERAFSATELNEIDKLALRITDNKKANYETETNHLNWMKSNPFGYAKWFENRARISSTRMFSLNESIQPVPKYNAVKLPLQRVVQILKRHRDMMFNGHEHKPISVIITTLAAKSYNKETNIIDALTNVIEQMPRHIEERYSYEHGRKIKWVANPVNDEENFADRWVNEPQREENFYKWMRAVRIDIDNIISKRGIQMIQDSLETPFGKDTIIRAFSNYADNLLTQRERGEMKMAAGTGMIGVTGRTDVLQHKPFGKNE